MNNSLRWKVVAGLVAVFAAGFMTGGLVGAHHARYVFQRFHHRGSFAEGIKRHLRSDLKLTGEQMEKIGPVVDQAAGRMETVRTESGKRVEEAMTETDRQIEPYLSPEQRTKFQSMRQRHEKMMRERRFPPGGPPEN